MARTSYPDSLAFIAHCRTDQIAVLNRTRSRGLTPPASPGSGTIRFDMGLVRSPPCHGANEDIAEQLHGLSARAYR